MPEEKPLALEQLRCHCHPGLAFELLRRLLQEIRQVVGQRDDQIHFGTSLTGLVVFV